MGVLGSVIDPELGDDIVSLGMVPDVTVDPDGNVRVAIKLTIGGCPLRADIKREVERRVGLHPGVVQVNIEWGEMNADELWATTMDPTARVLLRVDLEDQFSAEETFSVLMGSNVESRRRFIQENAKDVRFLDF